MAGQEKKVPRGVHYVCRLGTCDFYQPFIGIDGEQVSVVDNLVPHFAAFGIL